MLCTDVKEMQTQGQLSDVEMKQKAVKMHLDMNTKLEQMMKGCKEIKKAEFKI